MKKITIIRWLLLLLACPIPAFAHTHQMEMASEPQTDSLFNISDTWTTSEDKPFHLIELKGGPTVIAMIYTACKDICPLIVEDMKKIERHLPASQTGKIRFAVFSFDPDRDSTKVLKEYAKSHGIDSSRWTIARSNPEAVRRLAVALGVKYKKTKSGDYQHSKSISILNEDGIVKFQQSDVGQDGEDAVLAIKNMLRDATVPQ